MKIYRTFQDLNTDIHKSRNNFIIEALLRYINGISDEDLTFTGAKKKQRQTDIVTQSEIAELETRIIINWSRCLEIRAIPMKR